MKVYIINGPNLNLLGRREKEHYGNVTLKQISDLCEREAQIHDIDLRFEQSNCEGRLIDLIHEAIEDGQGIIINAGAYTHSSIALLDALKIFNGPVVEVHLSNIHNRENYRHNSYIAQRADGIVCGFGEEGYIYALQYIVKQLKIR